MKAVRQRHDVVDDELARVVEIDADEVWRRVDAERGDLSDILDAARRVAAVDGPINAREEDTIAELEAHCGEG